MPRHSKRVKFLRQLGEAAVSHHVFADVHKFQCADSDDNLELEKVVDTKVVAAVQYAALIYFRYIYRATSYPDDVRERKLGRSMPEWKKIILGYMYNEEEFLKMFQILG
jgi:hypothetical protein